MSVERYLSKAKRLTASEAWWRAREKARTLSERTRVALLGSSWKRDALTSILGSSGDLRTARHAAARRDWAAAHAALARLFSDLPARFVLHPSFKAPIVAEVTRGFPSAVGEARNSADRILSGSFDLLGFKGLRFDNDSAGGSGIDWSFDPVYRRRAPHVFWADVPFLDPRCGDHKTIWELNRHQTWLVLGRAFWLTGDRRYRDEVLRQSADWLASNPPLAGINWASMLELALRSVSWVWAINFFVDPDATDDSPWLVDWLVAMNRQLDHVEHHLSYYFSPNTHLLGEGLALYVTGLSLPMLAHSSRRVATGRRILLDEAARQIAPDGGHLERSTHYHRYTLDFYLLALAVARINKDNDTASELAEVVARLTQAARLLADHRGRLHHIGDDDGGMTLPIAGRAADDIRDSLAIASHLLGETDADESVRAEEARWLLSHPALATRPDHDRATRREPTSGALRDTGYYISRSRTAHLIVDGGALGYQNAGHAHADALMITMSVDGMPCLIDPGTGCYTVESEWRDRLRATASHNTVTIDNRSQSIPSGPFHWSHVAETDAHSWRTHAAVDYFHGSHDGYAPLVHHRWMLVVHDDLVVVADLVDAERRPDPTDLSTHRIDVSWHVDPDWQVDVEGRRALLSQKDKQVSLTIAASLDASIDRFTGDRSTGAGWHAPVYGRIEPATTLRTSLTGQTPVWIVSVFGIDANQPVVDAQLAPVFVEAGVLRHAVGITIQRTNGIDRVLFAERGQPAKPTAATTWRVGDVETDAAMLFCRSGRTRRIENVAAADVSVLKTGGRVLLTRSAPLDSLHLDRAALERHEKIR
jgi:uncharacterized heparinase superfamily protein